MNHDIHLPRPADFNAKRDTYRRNVVREGGTGECCRPLGRDGCSPRLQITVNGRARSDVISRRQVTFTER